LGKATIMMFGTMYDIVWAMGTYGCVGTDANNAIANLCRRIQCIVSLC